MRRSIRPLAMYRFLSLALVVFLNGVGTPMCAQQEAVRYGAAHPVPRLAILPPAIDWKAPRRVSAVEKATEESLLSSDYQGMLFEWLAHWKKRRHAELLVQAPDRTNQRLEALGYFDGQHYTDSELADSLGVDHLLVADCRMKRPGDGVWGFLSAATIGMAVGDSQWTIELLLIDKTEGQVFWDYRHRAIALDVESPVDLLRRELRRASKRMPYFAK